MKQQSRHFYLVRRLLAKDRRNWKYKVFFYSVFMWHVYVIWWGASAKNDLCHAFSHLSGTPKIAQMKFT